MPLKLNLHLLKHFIDYQPCILEKENFVLIIDNKTFVKNVEGLQYVNIKILDAFAKNVEELQFASIKK